MIDASLKDELDNLRDSHLFSQKVVRPRAGNEGVWSSAKAEIPEPVTSLLTEHSAVA